MKMSQMFPSQYITAADVEDADVILTIKAVKIEQVGKSDDPQSKPVIHFDETEKTLTLNKTNAKTIEGIYGSETDLWIGKPISLFATETEFAGKPVLAVRIRIKAPTGAPTGLNEVPF